MKVSDLRNTSKKTLIYSQKALNKALILIKLYRFVNESNTYQMCIDIVHQTHVTENSIYSIHFNTYFNTIWILFDTFLS